MGDCQVQSISWLPNAEDIQIGFLLDEGSSKFINRKKVIIQFIWVSNLKIDMDFGDYSGMGLTWEVKIKKQTKCHHKSIVVLLLLISRRSQARAYSRSA